MKTIWLLSVDAHSDVPELERLPSVASAKKIIVKIGLAAPPGNRFTHHDDFIYMVFC